MKKICLLAAVLIAASGVQATLIDFDFGYTGSNWGSIPTTYQPLAGDGATIDYHSTIGMYIGGGDHTTGSGYNAWEKGSPATFSFDKDVQMTSVWLGTYLNASGAALDVTVTAFSDAAGTSQIAQSVVTTTTHPVDGQAFVWTEFTGFSGLTNVRRLEFTAGAITQIDDMSINVIPEPATLGLIGFAGVGVLFVRRRFMI